jgi:alanine racemase
MSQVIPADKIPSSTPLYRCWAEVDLEALRENLACIRRRVGPGIRIMTVVKADAYGHGLKCIAGHLMRCGTDVFGVANLAEARAIRSVGRGWPILCLGACLPGELGGAIRDGVMLTVSSVGEAEEISREAERRRCRAKVHLKVDTGMGRLGVSSRQAVGLARRLTELRGTDLVGVYTHFASAEDDAGFTARQRSRFDRVLRQLQQADVRPPVAHACNSAGVIYEADAWYDLVRPGLLVYGLEVQGRRRKPSRRATGVRPALSLRARVALVREVPRGTTVSYGATFVAPRRMRLATVSVGYGDGYPLVAGERARVLIRGRRCRVVGRVTMDQTVVDVSRVDGVKPGDEVVLIGSQGRGGIHAEELAAWCGTIPWEVLTGISYRVPRVYRGIQAS